MTTVEKSLIAIKLAKNELYVADIVNLIIKDLSVEERAELRELVKQDKEVSFLAWKQY